METITGHDVPSDAYASQVSAGNDDLIACGDGSRVADPEMSKTLF